jgi:hypothetical protein
MKTQLDNIKRVLKAVAILLFNIIQLGSALIALFATTAGIALIAWILNQRSWILPLVAFFIGSILTLALTVFSYYKIANSFWLINGYRIIFAEYLYRIHDDDPTYHSQTVKTVIEATRPGVNIFEFRYFWSGRGVEELRVISPFHRLLGEPIERSNWKYYYVHLGEGLAVGGRTEITIIQELHDTYEEFKPFLAKTIAEPIEHVVLRVIWPKKRLPSQTILNVYSGIAPAFSLISRNNGKLDTDTGEVKWEIQSPKLNHRYEIQWI